MLQCTALTNIPEIQALVALTTMPDGPDNPPDTGMDGHALCELGEHDAQHTQHAARLWAVHPPATHDLWLLWTGTGRRHTHHLVELPQCPATLHHLTTGPRSPCTLYDHHPTPHSWHITDPLRDLLVSQVLGEIPHTHEDTFGMDGTVRHDEGSTEQS
ncbi:hypothetical protein [Streptomyces sp. CB01580]|uniref:hypothetical protein n=2 Tax=unclassified Streptomyces TaxID=2593676 RepID=UPI00093B91F6|nr:hypothetical protein [Streptomyces sp. CB01580]OKJ43528.1 hypothetical protein AMK22_02475 [Streptomyces sp. CB01580]